MALRLNELNKASNIQNPVPVYYELMPQNDEKLAAKVNFLMLQLVDLNIIRHQKQEKIKKLDLIIKKLENENKLALKNIEEFLVHEKKRLNEMNVHLQEILDRIEKEKQEPRIIRTEEEILADYPEIKELLLEIEKAENPQKIEEDYQAILEDIEGIKDPALKDLLLQIKKDLKKPDVQEQIQNKRAEEEAEKLAKHQRDLEEFEEGKKQLETRLNEAKQLQNANDKSVHNNLMKEIELENEKRQFKDRLKEAKQLQNPNEKLLHENLLKEILAKKQIKKDEAVELKAEAIPHAQEVENVNEVVVPKAEEMEMEIEIEPEEELVLILDELKPLVQVEAEKDKNLQEVVKEQVILAEIKAEEKQIEAPALALKLDAPLDIKVKNEKQNLLKTISHLFSQIFSQILFKWPAEILTYTWKKMNLFAAQISHNIRKTVDN